MDFMNKLAGNEYVGFSNATWVQRHMTCVLSHINFSLWVNPVSWLATCWAGVSLPNIPGSSRSASQATGTSPSATTWRRRRWVLAPRPLARRCFFPSRRAITSPWLSPSFCLPCSVSRRAPTWRPSWTSTSRYTFLDAALLSACSSYQSCQKLLLSS